MKLTDWQKMIVKYIEDVRKTEPDTAHVRWLRGDNRKPPLLFGSVSLPPACIPQLEQLADGGVLFEESPGRWTTSKPQKQ